jgi:PKD repeat protein
MKRIDVVAAADARLLQQFLVGNAPESVAPNQPPMAAFSFVADGLSVEFTDESTDADGTVVAWLWDFGDESDPEYKTDQHPTHEYAEDGEYTVRLTVTDDDGATVFVEQQVEVSEVVPTDGPDSWYLPTEESHFTTLGLAIPDYIWTCDEASGDLIDKVTGLALTAFGTPSYQQSVSGWSAPFVGVDGSAGEAFASVAAGTDLAAGESFAILVIGVPDTPAAGLTWTTAGGGTDRTLINASGLVFTQHNGVLSSSGAQDHTTGAVHQFLWYRDATANLSGTRTDLEHIPGTHDESASSDQRTGVGAPAGAATSCAGKVVLVCVWKDANAEQDWDAYLATMRGE